MLFLSLKIDNNDIKIKIDVLKFLEIAYFSLLRLTDINVSMFDHNLKGDFEDEYLKIKAIKLNESNSKINVIELMKEKKEDDEIGDFFKKIEVINQIHEDFFKNSNNGLRIHVLLKGAKVLNNYFRLPK